MLQAELLAGVGVVVGVEDRGDVLGALPFFEGLQVVVSSEEWGLP